MTLPIARFVVWENTLTILQLSIDDLLRFSLVCYLALQWGCVTIVSEN